MLIDTCTFTYPLFQIALPGYEKIVEIAKGRSSSARRSSGTRRSSSAKKPVDLKSVCNWVHGAMQTWADVMMLRQQNLDSLFSKIYTVETGLAAEVCHLIF